VAACWAAAAPAGIDGLDRSHPIHDLPTAGHRLQLDHYDASKQHLLQEQALVQPPASKHGTLTVKAPNCSSLKDQKHQRKATTLGLFHR
jgi:hypothetical protein